MSGNRAILIPEATLESVTLSTGGPTSGLKTRPAVRNAANEGRLDPVPSAVPGASYDIDVFERTAGLVGSARAGFKDASASVYKAKAAAHIPHHVQWLRYGTTDSARFVRPKALSMQSGELLLLYRTWDGSLNWRTFDDAGPNAEHTSEPYTFTAANFVMADVVQMADGELVMMVLGIDAQNEIRLVRKTSKGDTDATIAWRFGPAALNKVGFSGATLAFRPTGMAIEVLPSGRIAMLIHRYGVGNGPGATDIVRTYSDDRGVTWADLETASNYEEQGYGVGSFIAYFGGVDIKRDPDTGSLVAVVGVSTADSTVMPNVMNDPSVIGLVSDDGDNWNGLVKTTMKNVSNITTEAVYDFPFFEEGMLEASVVFGDDGLCRFIGSFHGDSGNATVSGYFDDLCTLSARKPSIAAKDAAPVIPAGILMGSVDTLTCSDMFAAQVEPLHGFRRPVRTEIALNRFAITFGVSNNDLDASPVYSGPRFVEAVNHRGAIWLFMACVDTTATQYALGYMLLQPWTELWERGGSVTAAASALLGYPYRQGWMAHLKPADAGLVIVNGAAQTLSEASRGLLIAPAAAASTFEFNSVTGTRPNPTLVRFLARPISGGSVGADDIAARLKLSDGTNYVDLSIRFDFSLSTIRAVDNLGAATIGDDLIDLSLGVEVVVALAANLSLIGIFYRPITADPEDAVTIRASGSASYALVTAVGTAETLTFGTHTASSPTSAWFGAWFNRGASAGATGAALLWDGIFAWDAATPLIPEFGADEADFDDGLRQGARPMPCRATPQYYRKGMELSWKGAAGREGNRWDAASGNRFEAPNILRLPVGAYWRSEDDGALEAIVFDAGNDARWNPDAAAFFGLNARRVLLQFNATNVWTSPSVSIVVDVTSYDVARFHTSFSSYTVGGADSREIIVTGASAQPMTPHQFRSNDRQSWYVWNAGLAKSIKILDNEGYKLNLAASGAGASGINYIFPDRICFDVTGGALGATGGYRYMRIRLDTQDLYEGHHTIGQFMVGKKLLLSNGMQPEWGWTRVAEVPTQTIGLTGSSSRIASLYDGALERWQFGWSGLRDRAPHSLSTFQGVRNDFAKLVDAYQRLKGGEVPCVLMPTYEDGRATASKRSFEAIVAAMEGPAQLTQIGYECAADSVEGTIRELMDLGAFTFSEQT